MSSGSAASRSAPTAWAPRAKPIWLTEIGVPAVDKGANEPNVFPDPKSSESAIPPFSGGSRDDLIQVRALEAILWLTEIGIPAVDKGTNGPNVFPDPKSSESAYPPFSRGSARRSHAGARARGDPVPFRSRARAAFSRRYNPDLACLRRDA